MSKLYGLRFGNTKASVFTGLSPTFTIFALNGNGASLITPPGITESPAGSGIYEFTYGPTLPIVFEIDAGNTVAATSRYLYGILDPIQAVDQQMTSLIGLGSTQDSIGFTASDPSTLFGYVRRAQENQEGNATFVKATGSWNILTRGGTLLTVKALTDSVTQSTKS